MRASPWLLGALLVTAFAVLVALGAWQLSRHREKQEIKATFDARTAAGPLGADAARALPPEQLEFRRVRLSGRWDHARTMTVTNRIRFGVRGEEVVTPLLVEGGPAVLINRGWYPLTRREQVRDAIASQERGFVDGLARYIPTGSARQTVAGAWTRLHVASMAESLPYPVAPWSVVAGDRIQSAPLAPPDELPVTGWLVYENTIPHLGYALTWWGLAVALVVTSVLRFGLRRNREQQDAEPSVSRSRV